MRNALLPPNDPVSQCPGAYARDPCGADIYSSFADGSYEAVPVDFNTTVYAADGGTVIRADWKYAPMTPGQWREQAEHTKGNPRTFVLRSFGAGRCGSTMATRRPTYNHLSEIDRKIVAGGRCPRAAHRQCREFGPSGRAEGKKYGAHLHFEIWVDGFYLGYGMAPADVKKYFSWIFLLCTAARRLSAVRGIC